MSQFNIHDSIKDDFDSQKLPVCPRRLSTPWSDRVQSHELSRTASPATILPGRRSTSQAQPRTPNIKTSSNKLTREEKIVLFRLLSKFKHGFLHRKKGAFWRDIQKEFKAETGKEHETLQRVAEKEAADRKLLLESVGSGQEVSSDPLTDLVDEWNEVLDSVQRKKEAAKKDTNALVSEAEQARQDRENLLLPRCKKTRRRQDSASSTSESESNKEALLQRSSAPPESPRKHKPKSKRRRKQQDQSVRDGQFMLTMERMVDKLVGGESEESKTRLEQVESKLDTINTQILAILQAVNSLRGDYSTLED